MNVLEFMTFVMTTTAGDHRQRFVGYSEAIRRFKQLDSHIQYELNKGPFALDELVQNAQNALWLDHSPVRLAAIDSRLEEIQKKLDELNNPE